MTCFTQKIHTDKHRMTETYTDRQTETDRQIDRQIVMTCFTQFDRTATFMTGLLHTI